MGELAAPFDMTFAAVSKHLRVLEAANDAVEQVRLAHRGLDGVRTDLYMLLRAMGIEGRYERG